MVHYINVYFCGIFLTGRYAHIPTMVHYINVYFCGIFLTGRYAHIPTMVHYINVYFCGIFLTGRYAHIPKNLNTEKITRSDSRLLYFPIRDLTQHAFDIKDFIDNVSNKNDFKVTRISAFLKYKVMKGLVIGLLLTHTEGHYIQCKVRAMDQISIKTPNRKCRLYCCLIEFRVYRPKIQSVILVFSTPLENLRPPNLLTG